MLQKYEPYETDNSIFLESRADENTHNTDLKKKLNVYTVKYPDICKLIDEEKETGCKSIVNAKRRFSVRLTAPYSEERRRSASEAVKEKGAFSRTLSKLLAVLPFA